MSSESYDDNNASRLRQRLWGASVLIAIAVIILPLILDGAGSESQFRQVERLREEPASITLRPEPVTAPTVARVETAVAKPVQAEMRSVGSTSASSNLMERVSPNPPKLQLSAWVIQAAAFTRETEALVVRDKLRSAGFASFVRDRDADTDPFRVLVGPMIKKASAEKARLNVAALLQNDPIILTYP